MKKYLILGIALALKTGTGFSQWTTVCGTGNGFVDNFEVYNNELYATGFFSTLCGTPNNHIVKFDGSAWQSVGTGYPYAGHQLKALDGSLYFAGYQPNIDSNWVYQFDGTNFNKLGKGVYLTNAVAGFSQTANLYALEKYDGKLVASGEFDRVGSDQISGIMQWDGTSWSGLGSGLSGHIPGTSDVMYPHDMCHFGNKLVVCGSFLQAGGITVNGIAQWDGTQWQALGSGFNGAVYGVCEYNGALYAGGDFTLSGTTPLKRIARWNGSAWEDPGFGIYYTNSAYYAFVHTLKVLGTKMYVAGGFDRIEFGGAAHHGQAVFAFDGTNVDTLNGGTLNREIEAIAWFDGKLYAGGGINNSNSFIAKYTSTAGIEEAIQDDPLNIFPNPSQGNIMVSATQPITEIKVFNILGQLVESGHPNQSSCELKLAQKGQYVLVVSTETGMFSKLILNE